MSMRKYKFKLHEVLVEELIDYVAGEQGLKKVVEEESATKTAVVNRVAGRLKTYSTRENLEVREFISNLGMILRNEDMTDARVEECIRQTAKNFYNESVTVELAVLEGTRYCFENRDRRDVIKLVNDDYLKGLEGNYTNSVIENRRKAMFSKIKPNLYDRLFAEHVQLLNENGTTHSQINPEVLQGIHNFSALEAVADKVLETMFGKQLSF